MRLEYARPIKNGAYSAYALNRQENIIMRYIVSEDGTGMSEILTSSLFGISATYLACRQHSFEKQRPSYRLSSTLSRTRIIRSQVSQILVVRVHIAVNLERNRTLFSRYRCSLIDVFGIVLAIATSGKSERSSVAHHVAYLVRHNCWTQENFAVASIYK